MVDVVSTQKRRQMMSGITAKNTAPERIIRQLLSKSGYRYRLHQKKLCGNPDIVLKKYRSAIFINGCFWHMHNCHLFKWPSSNSDFWKNKIRSNSKRDKKNYKRLIQIGWRVLIIWECAIKGKHKLSHEKIQKKMSEWLETDLQHGVVKSSAKKGK